MDNQSNQSTARELYERAWHLRRMMFREFRCDDMESRAIYARMLSEMESKPGLSRLCGYNAEISFGYQNISDPLSFGRYIRADKLAARRNGMTK